MLTNVFLIFSVMINDKKEKIIEAAFSEWSKENFKNTSLSMIAKKLKLTKAAFYRYFKNKEQIINEMKKRILNVFVTYSISFINDASISNNFEEIVKKFVHHYFYNFASNIPYFLFFLHFLVKSDELQNDESFLPISEKINSLFKETIKLNNEEVVSFIKIIFSTGFFVILYNFHNKSLQTGRNFNVFNEEEINKICNIIYKIIVNSIKNNIAKELNFSKIELEACVHPEEIPEKNKIFDAIIKVIARKGIWQATIGEIAKELNMNKSSLYFYFNSKSQMFKHILNEELKRRDEIIYSKTLLFDTFEEKIYAIIVALTSYFLADLKILNFFDWLHYQGRILKIFKNLHKKKIEIPEFIIKIFTETGEYKTEFEIPFLFQYLVMQIIREIIICRQNNKEVDLKNMRTFYRYFLNGLFRKE